MFIYRVIDADGKIIGSERYSYEVSLPDRISFNPATDDKTATHYINSQFVNLTPAWTVQDEISSTLSRLATFRFRQEVKGVTVNRVSVRTDRESQATLTGAYVAVQLDPTRLIKWKGSDGIWTQIDKATVETLARVVADHVQACFDNEELHTSSILNLTTVEDVEAYDFTTGWPP